MSELERAAERLNAQWEESRRRFDALAAKAHAEGRRLFDHTIALGPGLGRFPPSK